MYFFPNNPLVTRVDRRNLDKRLSGFIIEHVFRFHVSTLVQVRVPAESFVLSETLSEIPDLKAEIQPTVLYPNSSENPVMLLWATCDDFDTLERSLQSDDSLRDASLVTAFDERKQWLFRTEWAADAVTLPLLTADGAIILAARSWSDAWDVRMFFSERQILSQAYEDCRDEGNDLRVSRIREASEVERVDGTDLTLKQYEALVVAHQLGYYEIPRRTSAKKVAEALDISHQALSERLCRGYRNLIDPLLKDEETSSPSDPFGGQLRFDPEY